MSRTQSTSFSVYGNVVYQPLLSSGVYAPGFPVGNCVGLSFQSSASTDSILGNSLCDNGTTKDTIVTPGETQFGMSFNQVDERALTLSFQGTEGALAGSTVSQENIPVSICGGLFTLPDPSVDSTSLTVVRYTIDVASATGFTANSALYNADNVKVGHISAVATNTLTVYLAAGTWDTGSPLAALKLENGNTVINAVGGSSTINGAPTPSNVALTLDTDFTWDADCSEGTVISAAALDVTGLEAVLLNYDYTQFSGSNIDMFTNTETKGRIILNGKNRITTNKIRLVYHQVNISPNAAVDLIQAAQAAGQAAGRSVFSWGGTAETVTGLTNTLQLAA